MVKFITGRSGSGKTEYCFNKIKELAGTTEKDLLLLTPEQYNFTAERRLLTDLTEKRMNSVENTSFSRLYSEVTRVCGGGPKELSKGARAAIMKKALSTVSGNLKFFTGKKLHSSFVETLLQFYDEFKSCGNSTSVITEATEALSSEKLADKLSDISLIFGEYEKIVGSTQFDSACRLELLYNRLSAPDCHYLDGRVAFIDGFNSFAEDEYKIVGLLFQRCSDVTVTLELDTDLLYERYTLFSHVNKTYARLKEIARGAGCEITSENLPGNRRTEREDLLFCEKNLFAPEKKVYEKEPQNIELYSSRGVADECDYVSIKICEALRNGARARDIAVICRDKDKYEGELTYDFRKYEIPYFDDERQAVSTQPLMVFIHYLLNVVIYNFRSDDILSLAKTGLTNLTFEETGPLENYIYVWSIDGYDAWSKPFEAPVGGLEKEDKDDPRLQKIEETRKYLFEKLNKFKNSLKSRTALSIGKAIYYALLDFGVNKNLKTIAESLFSINKDLLADEQGRVWELAMETLNQLAEIEGEDKISLRDYADLFSIMVTSEDLGVLPQGLDNVIFTSADRARLDKSKYVFILGANEDEFPLAYTNSGILSENDRRLLEGKITLHTGSDVINSQERYFAYQALSVTSEKLTVCYCGSGGDTVPSSIVTELKELFPHISENQHHNLGNTELIESTSSAFELMTRHFEDNSEFYASLREYFKNDSEYAAIENLSLNTDYKIENGETATRLFGKNMSLSASRMEEYYKCRFRYFCQYGLSAKPVSKAEMNALEVGTITHYVLENLIRDEEQKNGIKNITEDTARELTAGYLDKYLKENLAPSIKSQKEFMHNLKRMSTSIAAVVSHIGSEFAQSKFESVGYEVKIAEDGEVQPRPISLRDGGTVRINGKIDRVDSFTDNGRRYVRVVDYKTGKKDFKLSDILNGLNLQMFIYLSTICRDAGNKYFGAPAGVLYMHASHDNIDLTKVGPQDAEAEFEKSRDKSFQMSGLVLYDAGQNVMRAMEPELAGRYIPVTTKKDNTIKKTDMEKSVVNIDEFNMIFRKIDRLIVEMGDSLHAGLIDQNPADKNGICEYCDYSPICAFKKEVKKRELLNPKKEEAFATLSAEEKQ